MLSEVVNVPLNELVRVVVLPILFVFLNGVAEIFLAISYKGIVQPGRTIKVVYQDVDGELQEWHTVPSKVADFKKNHPNASSIVVIEQRATYKWYDYPSIPLNLCFAALLADGMSLFSPKINKVLWIYKWVFLLHICAVIAVFFLNIKGMKEEENQQRRKVMFWSFSIGLLGAAIGFIALRNVL